MKPETFDLSAHNARIFCSSKLADWYAGQTLCAAETMIVLRRRDAFANRRVLDLGVGSGRTTRFLLPFAADYVGIDFSPQMLAKCRAAFPAARLYELDLRELGMLDEAPFDFTLASWAVLDALAPEERLRALQRIAALTARGGTFVMSAHNRDSDLAGAPPRLNWSNRPDRLLRNAAHQALAVANVRRMRAMRREEAEYALYNDMAHRWQGVFYYIGRQAQTDQLARVGFRVDEVVGEDGRLLAPGDDVSRDGCLHYVTTRI